MYIVRQWSVHERERLSHTVDVSKKLDRMSRLRVVTEVEYQMSYELSGFETERETCGFYQSLGTQKPQGKHS